MAPPPLKHVILDLISLVWQISRVELIEIGVTLLLRVSSKVLSMQYYFSADALMNKLLIAHKSAAMMTFTKQIPCIYSQSLTFTLLLLFIFSSSRLWFTI